MPTDGPMDAAIYRWADGRGLDAGDDQPVLVLLDPPYREYEVRAKRLNQLLAGLVGSLPAGSAIVLE